MQVFGIQKNRPLFLVFMLLGFMLLSDVAQAHRVNLFAWVEGDSVHLQAKFGGGRKAQNALVEVYNAQGAKLLEGKTNASGEFSFPIPEQSDLKIVLLAGMGHRAEWTIPKKEIQNALTNTKAEPPASEERGSEKAVSLDRGNLKKPPKKIALYSDELQVMIEAALDKKLKPMLKMLAESRDKGPTFKDIMGGIGYILGLVGLGAYVRYRTQKGKQSE